REVGPAVAPPPEVPEPGEEKLDAKALWRQIFDLQREARASGAAFLSDIRDSELGRLMLGSRVLSPKRGQKIIRRGERKRDLFLILTGQVDVRVEGRLVAVLGAGDVVGEIGLLLDTERTGDVLASGDDTTCLRLSESNLQELMAKDPAMAARITLGIAKALCLKLIRTNGAG
ncbi:MAG TPA: cyclic nucleotide-binding domain-containing protein, partial [Myxococcota bacterium]|nr:cyclic nucleotide-binding domain-containing protein [Myxococcota bacterium]